jgi:DUF4097 and DUF4098 domain-containing protein YvlB
MPSFPTPDSIAVTIELVGDVRITASDRSDTVVMVRPGDPTKAADIRAAEHTIVELTGDRLRISLPRDWRRYTPFGGKETIDVTVDLPTGSQLAVDSDLGNISAEGELGECRVKTAMGNIRLDRTGALQASTAFGSLAVDHVGGLADLHSGSGAIRVGSIDGAAVVKNGNGDTTIGDVTGDLRVKASNGDVTVGRARASAVAKSANGDVRIAEVARGTVVVETAAGNLEVGVREGTAAWLDVVTRLGAVRNSLDTTDGPTASDARVEVRARTSIGDITINRASATDATRHLGSDAS